MASVDLKADPEAAETSCPNAARLVTVRSLECSSSISHVCRMPRMERGSLSRLQSSLPTTPLVYADERPGRRIMQFHIFPQLSGNPYARRLSHTVKTAVTFQLKPRAPKTIESIRETFGAKRISLQRWWRLWSRWCQSRLQQGRVDTHGCGSRRPELS